MMEGIMIKFTHPITKEVEEREILPPFECITEAIRIYCERFYDMVIDATDKNIWNLFISNSGLDGWEHLLADDQYIEILGELYLDSSAYEDDFERWVDDYNYDHNLGEYAEEEDEEFEEAYNKKLYNYYEAGKYLEDNGIGCDPCQHIEGEYVCDLLDDMYDKADDYDTYYKKSTLDTIVKLGKKYREEQAKWEAEEADW